MNDEERTIIARARDYPYPFPRESFLYTDDGPRPFEPGQTEGRTPVLAIGSNQSPIRLNQKFGHDARHTIPVQRATLADFDVVYSAHIAAYGSVPAMLQAAAGCNVAVAMTWLDDEQLATMNDSELSSANYHLAELENLTLRLDDGRVVERMYVYVSQRGHVRGPDGEAMALRAVPCEGRVLNAFHTHDTLEIVRERFAAELRPEVFILQLVRDRDYRRGIIAKMSVDAVPFAYPMRIIE